MIRCTMREMGRIDVNHEPILCGEIDVRACVYVLRKATIMHNSLRQMNLYLTVLPALQRTYLFHITAVDTTPSRC